ncbi:MAG: VCBS repeat-containing protein [Actinobacteria bacterium]|nr:VCBS repeat-containing protein [Actinomycetota bacterium]
MGISGAVFLLLLSVIALLAVSPVTADTPWPRCPEGQDPGRYESYCRFESAPNDLLPTDPAYWKYSGASSGSAYHASLEAADPELFRRELAGVTGDAVEEAWGITTGRPDAVIAVLDAGIRWHDAGIMRDLVRKIYLNTGEIPPPPGADGWDRNGDGIFNVDDFAGDARVSDRNGNGVLDPQDLIRVFSDGEDDDANGYVDDIAGWDFLEDDNDPWDESDVGSGDRACAWSGAEANNGSGVPGTCPNAMLLVVRVGYASPVDAGRFAQGVIFAVDSGAWVIQSGMESAGAASFAQAAVDYACARGVPVILPADGAPLAGDEGPVACERTVQANAVTRYLVSGNGLLVQYPPSYLYLQDVEEGGAQTAVAVPADTDSAEAAARLAGIAALVISAAKDRVRCGLMWDYPGLERPLSSNEVRQILAMTADDIDFSGVSREVNLGALDVIAGPSQRFPTTPGWDPCSGYGRVNALRAVQAVVAGMIPPEAEITSPRWCELRSPGEVSLEVSGRVAAVRADSYQFTVEWGPGWTPSCEEWVSVATVGPCSEPTQGVLATLDLGDVYRAVEEKAAREEDRKGRDRRAFTVRVRVRDNLGNWGEDRKTLYIFHDEDSLAGTPLMMAGGVTAAPRLADLDGDGADEIVVATGDGAVHALRRDLSELAGWPVRTTPLPLHLASAAFSSGSLPGEAFAAVSGAPAVGDLDHDGKLEVVAGDASGRVYAWDNEGNLLPGFPVRSNPLYSIPERADWETEGALPPEWRASRLVPDAVHRLDRRNRLDRGFAGGPALANLDASGDGFLEIIATCRDGHVYAWRVDGTPLRGWPVKLADPGETAGLDPLTHNVRLRDQEIYSREDGTGILTAPAVADLDGDGDLEVICGSGEFYAGGNGAGAAVSPQTFAIFSQLPLIAPLLQGKAGDLFRPGTGRVYALHGEGTAHGLEPGAQAAAGEVPGNAYVAGWPSRPAMTMPAAAGGAAGETGSLAIADVDGDGRMEIGVSATAGPAVLLSRDGTSFHGNDAQGLPLSLHCDSAGAAAQSRDLPAMGATGGGCFARLDGDKVCYVSPTRGLRECLDSLLPADQAEPGGQLTAWRAVDGEMLPSSPLRVPGGLCGISPAVADIDGDGAQEILAGGQFLCLHALEVAGGEASGWPKFTGGHVVSSPAVGDLDGDGKREVVAGTREGWLLAWRTPAEAGAPADWPACGHDAWNTGCLETDARGPAGVADLAAVPVPGVAGGIGVRLTWTAAGDDGYTGTAMCYEIRYLDRPLDGNNWNEGIPLLVGKPMPAQAGTREEMVVEGPLFSFGDGERTYYFTLQARDEAGNLSPLSNLASLRVIPRRSRPSGAEATVP